MKIYNCSMCGKQLDIHNRERVNKSIRCIDCTRELQREEGKNIFIRRLKDKAPFFEYVSGNPNNDGKVVLKCKICGALTERNANLVRSKRKTTCFNCQKKETQEKKYFNKKVKNLIRQNKIENNRKISEIRKHIKRNTLYIKNCKLCGEEILTKNKQIEMCTKCKKRKYDKHHSSKSLKELYKRDKGVCYICGIKCDYEDYIYRGNTFIAGNYYPSIDHVIPLCKGGTDEWNNLKLAHRICNSYKGKTDILSLPYKT